MNFREWFLKSGYTMHGFSREVDLSHVTIRNLINGKPPVIKTVKKLIESTKYLPKPITYDIFPRVHLRGTSKTISGTDLFKRLLGKELKKKRKNES